MSNIKIQDVDQRIQYEATAGQTSFSIPFPFFEASDLVVYKDDSLQTLTTDYTISGAGSPSGGTLTLTSGAMAGDIITIEGDMPIDRTSIYSASISNLTGSDLNQDFNREVVMMKQIETTQNLLQLQYKPYLEVSQDVNVTRDRWLPRLDPSQVWAMNPAGTEIIAVDFDNAADAPADAHYFLAQPDGQLINGVNFGALSSGLLKHSVSAGVSTPATAINGTDYWAPGDTLQTDTLLVEDDIQHVGDTDNKIVFGTDTQDYQTGGSSRLDLSDSGVRLGGANSRVTTILDEDNMASNSATALATQQSIKAYVDSKSADIHFLQPVRVASTSDFASTYDNGTDGVGATLTASSNGAASIDGISLALNDRVLFKDQTSTFENGVYYVSQVGDGSNPAIYTRATDFDEPSEIVAGDLVTVLEGNTLEHTAWLQTADVTDIGTDPITFVQFAADFDNIVTIDGTQTVTGQKTFDSLFLGGDMDANTNKITDLVDPTAAQDAATKAYVDSQALGKRVLITQLTPTNVNTIDFEGFGLGYDLYIFDVVELEVQDPNSIYLYIRFKINGSYQNSDYNGAIFNLDNNGGTSTHFNSSLIYLTPAYSTNKLDPNPPVRATIQLYNPDETNFNKSIFWNGVSSNGATVDLTLGYGEYGGLGSTGVLEGMRFGSNGTTNITGIINIYGVET